MHGALPVGPRLEIWSVLLRWAAKPADPAAQATAGVLAAAFERHGTGKLPLAGLDAAMTRKLMDRWFPGADQVLGLQWPVLEGAHRMEPRYDEIEDLLGLLTEFGNAQAGSREEILWAAHAIAQGSLGSDHLWQDLHLPSRRELSQLMNHWFPRLAARNDRDMKWKKFLYKQLCDRAELSCRAPSCSVCSDYACCYGSEEVATA